MSEPRRILALDDSVFELWLLRQLLQKRYGPAVVIETYEDPALAIERLSADLDVLIIDWELPGYEGREIAALAYARGVDAARVIFLSGHSEERLAACLGDLPYRAIVSKDAPDGRAELLRIVDGLVDRPLSRAG